MSPPAQPPAATPPPRAHRERSLALGRLFGIPLRLHWSFFILVVFIAVGDWLTKVSPVLQGMLWIVALFVCVTIHELAHCLVARARGAHVTDILLLPFGGFSRIDELDKNPVNERDIAAAGPLASLALGGIFLGIALLLGSKAFPPTVYTGSWWARLGWMNLILAGFNLIPALPMDGGRILRASLRAHHSYLQATIQAARIARFAAFGMFMAAFFSYDYWLVLIAFFVVLASNQEVQEAIAREQKKASPEDPPPPPVPPT